MNSKISKKDHFENIKIFHDVEHLPEYSLYSLDLNRYFGDRSYNYFYKHLIEHKKISNDYFRKLFEKENNIKGLKKYEESFDVNKFKKALKKLTIQEINNNKKLKNPYFERISNLKNFLLTEYIKKKPKIFKPFSPEVPEVGRYSPSYNIVSKHVYEVNFSKTGLQNKNDNKNFDKNEGKQYFKKIFQKLPNNSSPKSIHTSKKIKTVINSYRTMPSSPPKKIFSSNKFSNSTNQKKIADKLGMKSGNSPILKKLYKKENIKLKKFKDNHCLKFEDYTSRQPLLRKISYNTEYNTEIPNYYTDRYIRGNIDFNKISSNKKIKSYFEHNANKIKNPPLGFYQPKYNSVMNKTRDIYFYKKALPSSRHRKLKKIIYSYDVPFNYQMVPSLNNYSKKI